MKCSCLFFICLIFTFEANAVDERKIFPLPSFYWTHAQFSSWSQVEGQDMNLGGLKRSVFANLVYVTEVIFDGDKPVAMRLKTTRGGFVRDELLAMLRGVMTEGGAFRDAKNDNELSLDEMIYGVDDAFCILRHVVFDERLMIASSPENSEGVPLVGGWTVGDLIAEKASFDTFVIYDFKAMFMKGITGKGEESQMIGNCALHAKIVDFDATSELSRSSPRGERREKFLERSNHDKIDSGLMSETCFLLGTIAAASTGGDTLRCQWNRIPFRIVCHSTGATLIAPIPIGDFESVKASHEKTSGKFLYPASLMETEQGVELRYELENSASLSPRNLLSIVEEFPKQCREILLSSEK